MNQNESKDTTEVSVRVGVAATSLKVTDSTIRRWCDTGFIRSFITEGGLRRIPLSEIERLKNPSQEQIAENKARAIKRTEHARAARALNRKQNYTNADKKSLQTDNDTKDEDKTQVSAEQSFDTLALMFQEAEKFVVPFGMDLLDEFCGAPPDYNDPAIDEWRTRNAAIRGILDKAEPTDKEQDIRNAIEMLLGGL